MAAEKQQIQVIDPIPLLDTGQFEHMQRIATIMARSSLIPDVLKMGPVFDERGKAIKENGVNVMVPLPYEAVLGNCFLIVNQSVRWGMDPFAVAQCVSVVHGKLCYEGKLVAAVIEAKHGISLDYIYDNKTGDQLGVTVAGKMPDGSIKTIEGTVGAWKTTGNNSPWANPGNHKRQLAYRGAREWARRHAPATLLGVYTDDEMSDLQSNGRTSQMRGIEPVQDAIAPSKRMKRLTAEVTATSGGEQTNTGIVEDEASSPPAMAGSETMGEANGADDAPAASGEAEPAISTSTDKGLAEKEGTGSAASPDTGKEAPGEPRPEPTDEASYKAWVFWWGSEAESYAAAEKRWKEERALRTKLQIPIETVDACKAFLKSKWEPET